MILESGLNFGLGSIPLITKAKTRSISAENPNGEKGTGGKESSNLGVGRKGRPCISLKKGETTILAQIQGSGVIQHMWFTLPDKTDKSPFVLRNLIFKVYWDNEDTPSVEVPLGDFFCNGFAKRETINSMPISVNPTGGLNCYFPMPFRKAAKVCIENQHPEEIGGFFYQISYALVDELPENVGYFHAQWNRTEYVKKGEDHVILDTVKGSGQYVGTYIALASLERRWWGEGELKFYLDGDKDWPTICGTGTEDYVGGAWCFADMETNLPASYNTPFLGYKYIIESNKIDPWYGHNVGCHSMYRWHIMDPIRFESELKVTIQDIGHNGLELFERSDDISTVAYWYQTEPHAPFKALADSEGRRPR
jgi:hypothetical protein